MNNFILIAHIVVCVFLIVLVLLQSGKEGMGVIFGGGSSSIFGGSGAGGVLTRLTTVVAVAFIATSLSYNVLTTDRSSAQSSVMDTVRIEDVPAPASAPAAADQAIEPVGEALVEPPAEAAAEALAEDAAVAASETAPAEAPDAVSPGEAQ